MSEESRLLARWESRSGKYWVELHISSDGCAFYRADRAGGTLGLMNPEQALIAMQGKLDLGMFQPDKAKTPMRRVK